MTFIDWCVDISSVTALSLGTTVYLKISLQWTASCHWYEVVGRIPCLGANVHSDEDSSSSWNVYKPINTACDLPGDVFM